MEKLCIVPFTKNEFTLVDFCPEQYTITSLISPSGYTIASRNISDLNNKCEKSYLVTNSIEKGVLESDLILISDVDIEDYDLYLFALKALEYAIDSCKKIICFMHLDDESYKKYKDRCDKENITCSFLGNYLSNNKPSKNQDTLLKKINVPVIYINEIVPDVNGYEVFIKLISKLQKENINVVGISEDIYNVFWNQKTLKFWKKDNPSNIIFNINKNIYDIYIKECPDIIIIKLPNPIMKFNDFNTFDSGLSAYTISQAVPGNACICCSYSGTPLETFWDSINENIKAKFGYPIFAVHVSNQYIDYTQNDYFSMMYISKDIVKNELNYLNQYNSLNFFDLSQDLYFDTFIEELKNEFFDYRYGVI